MSHIAFVTFQNCPFEQRPDAVPLNAVWHFKEITEADIELHEKLGYKVLTRTEYQAYIESISEDYEYWYENHYATNSIDRLRVLDLVQDAFKFYHPSKIDFRRHLKPDVNLNKTVTMGLNGRPQNAFYSYEGNLICKIDFEFESDAFNFMTKRVEKLGYYTRTGVVNKSHVIWEQVYNPQDSHHQTERIAERVEARNIIMNQIKSVLDQAVAAFYLAQGKTYQEILVIAGEFYLSYNNDIQMFINTGSIALRSRVQAEPEEGLMAIPVAQDKSVKDFLIERLSY